MEESIVKIAEFLTQHGYWVIFIWMFADQAALPLPSAPLLIACGALAATSSASTATGGGLELGACITVATIATLIADLMWFELGKRRGAQAISFVCRLSLEPESCVTTTRNAFGRFGPTTIVIAKYLPGVQTLAPASAGFVGAPRLGFLALDLLGALLYIVPLCVGGYYFQPQISAAVAWLSDVSGGLGVIVAALASMYVGLKAWQWFMFLRGHRLRRITPEQLYERRLAGESFTIIDLRQRLDFQLQPAVIEGALRIPITEINRRREEIPDRYDVVLVCT